MPNPPAQSGKALSRPAGGSTGLLPLFAAIGLAAVWWANPVQAQSDAACIGYMEADYMYRVAIEAAGDVQVAAYEKAAEAYSAAVDRAKTVRAAAIEKSNTDLEAAIAEATEARQIALDRGADIHAAAMEELTAARDAALAEADAIYASSMAGPDADLRAAICNLAVAEAAYDAAVGKANCAKAKAKCAEAVFYLERANIFLSEMEDSYEIAKICDLTAVEAAYDATVGKANCAEAEANCAAAMSFLSSADTTLRAMKNSHETAKFKAKFGPGRAKVQAIHLFKTMQRELVADHDAIRETAESAYAAAMEKARGAHDKVKQEVEADISIADAARDAAIERADAVNEETKNEADANRWQAHLEAYEGATSKIPSIMERVIAVDRRNCKLKYGDWSSAD